MCASTSVSAGPTNPILNSAPAVCSWEPSRLDVFSRDRAYALTQEYYKSETWYGWYTFGTIW